MDGETARLAWAHGYLLDEADACGRMRVAADGYLDFVPPVAENRHEQWQGTDSRAHISDTE